jgi:hypothetical protein
MPAQRLRLDTPSATSSGSVASDATGDTTAPELAPLLRSTPVALTLGAVRARRSTLASPIPALLAASMKAHQDAQRYPDPRDAADAAPLTLDARCDVTSRLTDEARASILEADAEYLVEVDPHAFGR